MTAGSTFGLHISGTCGTRSIRATGRLVAGVGADAPAWAMTGTLGEVVEVVMDLRDVTAIDARGVGQLVGLRQALGRRGTRLTIAVVSPRVDRVLRLTALDTIFGSPSSTGAGGLAEGPPGRAAGLCRCA